MFKSWCTLCNKTNIPSLSTFYFPLPARLANDQNKIFHPTLRKVCGVSSEGTSSYLQLPSQSKQQNFSGVSITQGKISLSVFPCPQAHLDLSCYLFIYLIAFEILESFFCISFLSHAHPCVRDNHICSCTSFLRIRCIVHACTILEYTSAYLKIYL